MRLLTCVFFCSAMAAGEKAVRRLAPFVEKNDLLNALFFNAEKSPVAFTQPNTVWNFVKEWNVWGLKKKDVWDFFHAHAPELQKIRPKRQQFERLWTFAYGLNDRWQCDLLDWKRGPHVRFILTKIDVFSRKVNAKVISSKGGAVVARAFKEILGEDGIPKRLQTDQGKEFFNRDFARVLKDLDIRHYFVHSAMKAAVVERFNRTLRSTLKALFERFPQTSIKIAVAQAVKGFNARIHSVTQMAPDDINQENHGLVLQTIMSHRDDMAQSAPDTRFRLKVGDRVRIATHPNQFDKGAAGTFTREVFVITHSFTRYPHKNIPIYKVKDLLGRPVQGIHYEPQLQKASSPQGDKVNPIVIRRHKPSGRKLVRYPDYPKDFEEWI